MGPHTRTFGPSKSRRKRLLKLVVRLINARGRKGCILKAGLVFLVLLYSLYGLGYPWVGSLLQWTTKPIIMHPRLWQSRIAGGSVGAVNEHLLWQKPPNPEGWAACTEPIEPYNRLESLPTDEKIIGKSGYLQVFLEGGLNQQRIGICNAVVVARLLNAVLILPALDVNPVWNDDSTFGEIFDITHFITALSEDVHIVTSPPQEFAWSTREFYATGVRPNRVKDAPLHAPAEWYRGNVLPLLKEYGIVAIAPFSHRLTFDGLDPNLQKLRCRVNFEALRFTAPIRELGDKLLERIRTTPMGESPTLEEVLQPTWHNFLALHLRFDKDMAAHSACYFGGGWAERRALRKYRDYAWQGRVEKAEHSEEELRRAGKCPLTPEETGLFLAGLGYDPSTRIYLASHEVYGGEARLAPLQLLFPNVRDKYDLASADELEWFEGHASRLAALDYHVALHADVLLSAAAGNMHNVLAGHRAFDGPKKTVNPDIVLLAELLANESFGWEEFSKRVQKGHLSRVGQVKPRKAGQSVYTYPAPDCMCSTRNETYRT